MSEHDHYTGGDLSDLRRGTPPDVTCPGCGSSDFLEADVIPGDRVIANWERDPVTGAVRPFDFDGATKMYWDASDVVDSQPFRCSQCGENFDAEQLVVDGVRQDDPGRLRQYTVRMPAILYVAVHATCREDAYAQANILRDAMRKWEQVGEIANLCGPEIPDGLRTGEIEASVGIGDHANLAVASVAELEEAVLPGHDGCDLCGGSVTLCGARLDCRQKATVHLESVTGYLGYLPPVCEGCATDLEARGGWCRPNTRQKRKV